MGTYAEAEGCSERVECRIGLHECSCVQEVVKGDSKHERRARCPCRPAAATCLTVALHRLPTPAIIV